MTDPDLKDLAELWQQPDAVAKEQFEAAARQVRRQARLHGHADLAIGILFVIATLVPILLEPNLTTLAIGGVLVIALLWLSWRRRKLRQMSRELDTSDRASFLDSSIKHVGANLRRVSLSLWVLPPGLLLAVMFKLSLRQGGNVVHPLEALSLWAGSPRGIVTLLVTGIFILIVARSRRNIKAELRRLEALRQTYQEEARLDDAGDR